MAELTYEDVRRATRDVVSSLQSSINELRNNVQTIRNETIRFNDLQNRVMNIERNLTELLSISYRLNAALQSKSTETSQDDLRLEQRIINLEHLIISMNQYIQNLYSHTAKLTKLYEQALQPGNQ